MKKTASLPVEDAAPPPHIGAAARWGAAQIAAALPGVNSALEARTLLRDALGFEEYAELLAREAEAMPPAAAQKFAAHIAARCAGTPVAYILGWREFYGRRFATTPAALIPRPETETLVEAALAHLPLPSSSSPAAQQPVRVLDLGCGCGAIGISIALARPQCALTLTDVSAESVELARTNAARTQATNIKFACGDWYAPLGDAADASTEKRFQMVVSNPPYVAADDAHLTRGDLRFEPQVALVGGADGLGALAQVARGAPRVLQRGGVLLLEHGNTQAAAVRQLLAAAGFCGVRTLADLASHPRVTLAVLP